MARRTNTAERRLQITMALLRVMAHKGYERASVAEVAQEAGLTPGLVHYHFKSKLEILLSLFDALVARQQARLERRLAEAGPEPLAAVEAFLDCHLALGPDRDPEALACWIAMSGEALRERAVGERLESALRRLADRLQVLLGRGVETGAFRCADPAAAAGALLATIQGYYVLSATAHSVIPRGSAAPAARRMAAGLLGLEIRSNQKRGET
jgi:TetR/AcrR family transcriptional regulator, transcriptional repressor of bet genes